MEATEIVISEDKEASHSIKKETTEKKQFSLYIFLLLSFLIVLLIIVIFIENKSLKRINSELLRVKEIQIKQHQQHIITNQFLLSTISWSDRRTILLLFMRDCIVSSWKETKLKNNIEEAYIIAESIVKECEKYENIDPLLILSLQYVESNFNKYAISKAGALGICQIMPSTGKLIAGYFNIEYSNEKMFNIEVNTKFAIKLIDFLYSTYQNWEQTLADYNGGPWQAYYYKNDKSKLSLETLNFVPKVLSKKKEYDSLFLNYKIDEKIKEYTTINK